MNVEKIKQYCYLIRLNRPIGIFLLLWPTLWALWLGGLGHPSLMIVLIFLLGTIVMRSAGCVINDFADRHFDGHVVRTRSRPLVTGSVTIKEALIFFFILMLTAFLLVLCLNRFTILLAFAGAFFAITYPFLKRFTHLPQAGLGVSFAWGVPMAFAALNNVILVRDWLVFFAALVWPMIYDTFYAMVDRPDDIKIGVKSTAILFGARDKLWIGLLQGLFLIILGWVGYLFQLHFIYYLSLFSVSILFIYQQRLIRSNQADLCFKAFLNNQWVGGIIFLGIVLSYCISGIL
jgi:4-hydroxybenzoate polyprenyltransferase